MSYKHASGFTWNDMKNLRISIADIHNQLEDVIIETWNLLAIFLFMCCFNLLDEGLLPSRIFD